MKSNYDLLGNHIRLIDNRNKDLVTEQVLGINIDKFFMPSVANVIGTDLSKYKLIQKGNFACNPMHVGRDERLPVALYSEDTPAIVSPAYFMFEIKDATVLNADFLMMWFRRPEFDRICWLHTDGSVRGGITWEDICRMEIPVPPIDEQIEIVSSYQAITERIKLKKQINENYKCKNEQTEKMRSFAFLDGVRSVEFPDDIQIVLFQKGMQPEQVWVKCWSFTDNELYGMLLNEPNQDFGVHYGSIIGFAPIKQENGILCVYNGKILDKQGN